MNQAQARKAASLLTVNGVLAVATTADHRAGEFESTHRWGVEVHGTFYEDPQEFADRFNVTTEALAEVLKGTVN